MPVFKVWNVHRTQKKCVIANSLQELINKGKQKLDFEGNHFTVVLEEDGTNVDEDEILLEFKSSTFILLEEGDKWISVSHPIIDDTITEIDGPASPNYSFASPTLSTSTMSSSTPPPSSSTLNQCETPVSKSHGSVKYAQLPTYSSLVQQHLRNGTPHTVWSKLISETANYYMDSANFMLNSTTEYQWLGKKMFSAYPSIEAEGMRPWSLFTSNVSQRIRHMRWRINKKSGPSTSDTNQVSSKDNVALPKRRCVELSSALPEEEYEIHITELEKEWLKPKVKVNRMHIKGLLKETFHNRRLWITSLPDGTISSIVEKFPCFEDGCYLLYDFQFLLGMEHFAGMKRSLTTFAEAIEGLIGEKGEGPERMTRIINFIEGETSFERGKGRKTCPIVTIKEDIADADIQSALTTPVGSPPHIMVFKSDGVVKGTYVVADNVNIDCMSSDSAVALLTLLAAYYVFDLDYPRIYSQVLGIYQTHVIKTVKYDGLKSKKYCIFSQKLKKKIEEVMSSEL